MEDSVVITEKLAKQRRRCGEILLRFMLKTELATLPGEPSTLTVQELPSTLGRICMRGPSVWRSLGIQDDATDGWYATLPNQTTRMRLEKSLLTRQELQQ